MVPPSGTHEDYARTHAAPSASPRSFGLLFAGILAAIGLWPLWRAGDVRIWALALAAALAGVALARPQVLRPATRTWMAFGALLHGVVSAVMLTVLFFALFTPLGLLIRLVGRDLLSLRRDPSAATYWHERTPPGPEPESLRYQF